MPPIRIGTTELIIILAIVVLLFGAGRIGRIAGEIGRAVRSLREGVGAKEKSEGNESE